MRRQQPRLEATQAKLMERRTSTRGVVALAQRRCHPVNWVSLAKVTPPPTSPSSDPASQRMSARDKRPTSPHRQAGASRPTRPHALRTVGALRPGCSPTARGRSRRDGGWRVEDWGPTGLCSLGDAGRCHSHHSPDTSIAPRRRSQARIASLAAGSGATGRLADDGPKPLQSPAWTAGRGAAPRATAKKSYRRREPSQSVAPAAPDSFGASIHSWQTGRRERGL